MMNLSDRLPEPPRPVEMPMSVLLLEDEVYYGKLIQRTLRTPTPQFKVTWVTTLAMALSAMKEENFSVVVTDLELPDASYLDALLAIRSADPEVPIVILTANSGVNVGLEAIRSGADDFIVKERVSADSLVRSIRYAVERKKCEDLRMRIEAIKDFTGMLAHDLRAPLIGASRVLECIEENSVAEEEKKMLLDHLRQSNKQLLNLVNELIDVYRVELAPPPVVLRPINLKPSLMMAMRAIAPDVQMKKLNIEEHIPDSLPLIYADSASLERVMTNLLDNACKFSPPGSSIIIGAQAEEDGYVRIDIDDSGPGIAPEAQATLFKRFWYGTPGKAYSTNGGLGLYLCHKIVTSLGGTISFQSSGKGTTFSVRLRASRVTVDQPFYEELDLD